MAYKNMYPTSLFVCETTCWKLVGHWNLVHVCTWQQFLETWLPFLFWRSIEFSDTGRLDFVSQSRALTYSLSWKKLYTHNLYQHEPKTSMNWILLLPSQTACKFNRECFWVASFLHDCSSDSEDFQAVVVADSNPVGLGGGPLDIIDLSFSCVGQYRVLNGPRHLLDVPD